MKQIRIAFFLILFIAVVANAQDTLTLSQAVETALKNNYSIGIAKNQNEISKNNNTFGNAGFLPQINFNASTNSSNNNTKQEYASGLSIDRNNVKSTGVNTGVMLNWTLFDGLKMFATHDKLQELEAMGELNLKMEIENTIAAVMNAYYDIIRQQQLLSAFREAIKIYEERLKIAEKKLEIGSASKLDVLQAKVDLNAQKSNLLKQKTLLDNTKASLNQLLSRSADIGFSIKDSIIINYDPNYEELKTTVLKQNNSLLFAQRNINVANYNVKEYRSLALPSVNLTTAYNFTSSTNQASFVLLNQNLGLSTGLSASWTLFNGLKNRTLTQNAKLQLASSRLEYNHLQTEVESSLLKAWHNLQNALEVLKLEEENYLVAKENVIVALERFRIGSSTSIEIITAQKSFEDAQGRLISERYTAKIAEIELMRLNGILVR